MTVKIHNYYLPFLDILKQAAEISAACFALNPVFCLKLIQGDMMKKNKTEDLRLDPEARLCPAFDHCSIKLFHAADPEKMGFRVLDNCAEEHMM